MVKRYYIQNYPEYFGCVLTGLRTASKIMSRTFWSTTQSKKAWSVMKYVVDRRNPEGKGEQSTNEKLETNSVLGIRKKDWKDSCSYHKK